MIPKARYVGPFLDYTGYGQATRNAIKALYTAGVPVTTEKVTFVNEHKMDLGPNTKLCYELQSKDDDYQVRFLHVTADIYYAYFDPRKYNIGHLFWETDKIPAEWVRNCNIMNEIWTGSEYGKKAMIKAGVTVPIFIYPQSTLTEENIHQPLDIKKDDSFIFYTIMEWNERKNPLGLLRAYLQEFTSKDKVLLILKTHLRDFGKLSKKQIQSDVNKLSSEFKGKDLPEFLMITDAMDFGSILRLHKTGDCFVSAHRGEGWGLPQVDALVTGNPIISTNLGGVHEYLDPTTAYLLNYKLKAVEGMNDFNPYYTKDQNWAEPDYTHLKWLMRKVTKEKEEREKIGQNGKELTKKTFSYGAVGNRMRVRLEKIAEEQKWNKK